MTDAFAVREMTAADVPSVAAIDRECIENPWNEKLFRESMDEPQYLFLVAEASGRIAGYAGLMMSLDEGEIMNIAVTAPQRRRGIARALMTELMRRGRQRGALAFTLEVRSSGAGAIALYESLGFRREGLRRGYYENPREDAVIMWKREV